ncbi:hypothetical protein HanRHA438_Chr04g0178241 [Helianthus annuus]|nr:hypothetical protein HanRHA438_Chr04g0178241 [Helianthus annuus]
MSFFEQFTSHIGSKIQIFRDSPVDLSYKEITASAVDGLYSHAKNISRKSCSMALSGIFFKHLGGFTSKVISFSPFSR